MFKTFSDFAKDKSSLENIANQFGYDFLRCILEFNNKELTEEQLADAKRLEKETILSLQVVNPTNEQIKREALIFPVIKQLILWTKIAKLECEYPLTANLDEIQLNGSLDYLIWGKKNLIVIEAKNDDFVGGAKQLIAEIVATILEQEQSSIYGAVSNGISWQFYKVENQQIIQDVNFYSFPQNSQDLFQVLVSIL